MFIFMFLGFWIMPTYLLWSLAFSKPAQSNVVAALSWTFLGWLPAALIAAMFT